MTNQEFNAAFQPFLDYFPIGEMSKEKINIYYIALSNLTVDQLNSAFISMVRNRVYKNFPQVAEIRQYATHTTENELDDRIVLARQIMKNAIVRYGYYSSVEFEDKGIHAVIDALDGWQKVCSMSADELEKFLTFEFPKIYKAYSRNNYQVTKYYIGYHDAMNGIPNINMISFKNMGKSLENVNNKVQSLNFKNSLLKDKDKEIKKLKDVIEKQKVKK
jgi:hypothetical protein|nr:MAG TPA: hypothetical protein [Caudoviricetes sp.]